MNTATIHHRLINRYKWLLILASAVTFLLFAGPITHAQSAANAQGKNVQITLSPTSQIMDITANSTYDGSFTIYNSGDSSLDFTVYAAPYQVANESYDPIFSKQTNRTQISRWVQFAQKEYTLQPGGKIEVPYTVTTPASIPDGGQYAALFAQTKGTKSGSIISQKRVGMLLYAHSNGRTINKASSEQPALGFWQSAPTFSVKQKVTNSGNTDFKADVTLTISDIFGHERYTSTANKTALPDTTRAISLGWDHTPPLALMHVATSVTAFGKTTHYSHLVLFATPTALFFVIVILLLIIIGGFYAVKKRRRQTTLHDN